MLTNYITRIYVRAVAAILLTLPVSLYAQSPLTVQPSTGRVGVGTTSPGYTLDVSGTVNAQYLRGDGSQLTNLPVGPSSTAIDKVTANTTVVNTSAETNLYSFSVPGGALGTNNVLRLTVQLTDIDARISDSCVLRFKYGGITFGSISLGNNDPDFNLTNGKAMLTMILAADGATNSQVASVFARTTSVVWQSPSYIQGTSAVDSNLAQTLVITADWNAASNSNSVTLGQAVLEKL